MKVMVDIRIAGSKEIPIELINLADKFAKHPKGYVDLVVYDVEKAIKILEKIKEILKSQGT